MSQSPSVDEIRREIEVERARLVESVSTLRAEIEEKRRSPLKVGVPLIAGATVAGFVLAGGIQATIRLFGVRQRRRRQRKERGVVAFLLGR